MSAPTTDYVLTLSCPDRPGIVHALTSALLQVDANITSSSQYGDADTGRFFIRSAFTSPLADVDHVRSVVAEGTGHLSAHITVRPANTRCRTIVMVSQYDHCLVDLLYRYRIGELPVDITAIVSNHEVCRDIAEQQGIRFEYIPVITDTKPAAEAALLDLVAETDSDLVVLARYMQILSADLCANLHGRIINIHHSFLPGFKGARPYHQAYARGVKLIGATAHYVTTDLDEGPIIEQDVVRVGHGHTPEHLAAIGRDVESRVLSSAVRAHAEGRIFLDGTRTVVFPQS